MIALCGHYRAVCTILSLPAKNAEQLLPGNCKLLNQTLTPEGTHPVVLLMGAHDNMRVKGLPFSWAYCESLIAVPWMQRAAKPCGDAPLAHVSHLWLDRTLPTIGGWLFGFAKTVNRVAASEQRYSVRTLISGHLLVEAAFIDHGFAAPHTSFPNFAAIRPVFEQTFIQRPSLIGPLCIETMDFQIPKATLQPVSATVETFPGFSAAIPATKQTFAPVDIERLGAFRIDCIWTLTIPTRCQS